MLTRKLAENLLDILCENDALKVSEFIDGRGLECHLEISRQVDECGENSKTALTFPPPETEMLKTIRPDKICE